MNKIAFLDGYTFNSMEYVMQKEASADKKKSSSGTYA